MGRFPDGHSGAWRGASRLGSRCICVASVASRTDRQCATVTAVDPDEVRAGSHQRIGQVDVVGRRRQARGQGLVEDPGRAGLTDGGDVVAAEAAAVGDQGGRLVAHAAVAVHTAVVSAALVPARAADAVGMAEAARDPACRERRRWACPRRSSRRVAGRVRAAGVAEVDELAEDVGQRLVDGARLVVVEERHLVVEDAVRELVGDDVVSPAQPVAEDGLLLGPLPLGVLPGTPRRPAVAHGGLQCVRRRRRCRRARSGCARKSSTTPMSRYGGVDLADAGWRLALAAGERAGCSGSCLARALLVVADDAVDAVDATDRRSAPRRRAASTRTRRCWRRRGARGRQRTHRCATPGARPMEDQRQGRP